jgi:tartrate-resistant acid phosphatase type 5
MINLARLSTLLLFWAVFAGAQNFRVYIGQLGHDSALVAWGTTDGGENTIGRDSISWGEAELRVGDRRAATQRNWAEVRGLAPDTEYEYEVRLEGRAIGGGRLRTWPAAADRLTFFVVGDYGNGYTEQYRIADAMADEFQRREAAGRHVRFVLTTGDNIYRSFRLGPFHWRSGDDDSHWESKFYRPYAPLIGRIPFLPTPGNHDGNSSESRGDLGVYLDNFFFPGNNPARWYRFSFGGLADFFALDTTENSESGPPRPVFLFGGPQHQWLAAELDASRAPWKIPYFHHAPFNAGPRHAPALPALQHFVELFRKAGVAAAFSGHEHNLQFSEVNEATGNMLFVVTGAGGELRRGDPSRNMRRANIAGWAAQRHFLVVEIEGRTMRIAPVSWEDVAVSNADGQRVAMPVVVRLP